MSVEQAFSLAVAHHQAGRLQEAEKLYSAILQVQASHPAASHNLGLLAVSTGMVGVALPWLKAAVESDPKQQRYWVSYIDALILANEGESARVALQQGRQAGLAGEVADDFGRRIAQLAARVRNEPAQSEVDSLVQAFNGGRFDEVENLARQMTQAFPQAGVGWKILGAARKQLGRTADALEPMQRSVELLPNDAKAHNNLGVVLRDLGRREEAEVNFRQAVTLNPGFAEAHSNLGATLSDLERLAEAEASHRQAIVLSPGLAEAHSNLGSTLKRLGKLEQAEASYRQAIALKPNLAELHNNLGLTLADLGRLAEAEASHRRAIELNPGLAETHCSLGLVLKKLGRIEEAEVSFRRAVVLEPKLALARNNLGSLFVEQGRLAEAEASYRQAIELKPDYSEAHSCLLANQNYGTNFSPTRYLEDARRFGRMVSEQAKGKFTRWRCPVVSKKLTIGFVSGDLRSHPVGYFLEGLVSNLDQSRFELIAYPTQTGEDELTHRIRPWFKSWQSLVGKNDGNAARLIHETAPHILIDLAGHTAHNRLPVFAYRPAPVQVSWLGYFASTGLEEMDYFLGDSYVAPCGEEAHFVERIWRLPETYLCFTPPGEPVPVGKLPALDNGHVTFGCFNNPAKMNDAVILLWSEVLRAVRNSRLFLKGSQFAQEKFSRKTRERFAATGIAGDRLILEGPSTRTDYLKAYHRVDLALDPFPYPGGTTSVEAFWMGVPVITLRGERFLSHLGETIAHNAGQSEWIAASREDYVGKAVSFALDLERLAALRARLREKTVSSNLCDNRRFARQFGEAMVGMWQASMLAGR